MMSKRYKLDLSMPGLGPIIRETEDPHGISYREAVDGALDWAVARLHNAEQDARLYGAMRDKWAAEARLLRNQRLEGGDHE